MGENELPGPDAESSVAETPAEAHTFLFADLAGYTALTEAHGDEYAADAAAEFCDHVRALLPECEGEEVKAIGDAVMIRVPEAAPAAWLAEAIVCGFGARDRALGVRIGMHTGTAVQRGDDWFGAAVNLASRVADVARAGEVLLTKATREALGDAVRLSGRGMHSFKNVAEPLALFELVWDSDRAPAALPIDPVCRMAIDPARADRRQVYRGVEYHFCSERCATAFAGAPARYARRPAPRQHLLVSDTAREQTVERLRRAYSKGRLAESELEERVERVYNARIRGELQTVTHDLPRRYRRRPLVVVFYRWMTRPIRHGWRRWRQR